MKKKVFIQKTKEDGFKQAFCHIESAEVETLVELLGDKVETVVDDGGRVFIHFKQEE